MKNLTNYSVHSQRTIFNVFHQHILDLGNTKGNTKELAALLRVLSLYGGNILIEHLGLLYEVSLPVEEVLFSDRENFKQPNMRHRVNIFY